MLLKKFRMVIALTIAASLHTVDSKSCVLLFDLSRLDRGQGLNRAQARIFSKGHWYGVECICERSHGILF